jgi:hypothetical protein
MLMQPTELLDGVEPALRELGLRYDLLLIGELDERPQVTVNIQQTAAFIAVRSVIFEALEDYPEVRAEISRKLRVLAESGEVS